MQQKEDSLHQSEQPVLNSPTWFKKLTMILTSVLLLTMFGLGGYWLGARRQQPSPTDLLTKLESSRLRTVPPSQQLSPTDATHHKCTNQTVYRGLEGLGQALKQPETVCHLDLSRSNLDQLPPQVLQLSNLESLYLNHNRLTHLPMGIRKLTNLNLIDLTGNPIPNSELDKVRKLLPRANHILHIE
jgi:Leucine-rich repeat (LRR) protein